MIALGRLWVGGQCLKSVQQGLQLDLEHEWMRMASPGTLNANSRRSFWGGVMETDSWSSEQIQKNVCLKSGTPPCTVLGNVFHNAELKSDQTSPP